jgi:uncharacterized membrane protein (DUF2068 family)
MRHIDCPSIKTSFALRTIAMLEVIQATIVLLLACGLFHLMHNNPDEFAERVVRVLHVDPEGKLSNLFFELASHSSDRNLWVVGLAALAYASVRLTEAYGLWRELEWAQWFSLLSTALYLPPELYWMLWHPDWLKGGVLVINTIILLFMVNLRVNGRSTVIRSIQLQSSMRPAISLRRSAIQACSPDPVSPVAPAFADLQAHDRDGRSTPNQRSRTKVELGTFGQYR